MVQEAEVKETFAKSKLTEELCDNLSEQFRIYTEDIQPLIINIEEMKSEFPTEILNEVRAMYTHLSRAFLASSEEDVKSNIEKIKRHTKRALLDCYKNSCMVIVDRRNFFFQKYKGIDLSYIKQGEFLKEEHNAYRNCVDSLKAAKKAEGLNTQEDELFSLYQNAYDNALVLDDIITGVEDEANFLKKKATKRDIAAIAFGIAGLIGTVISVISFFR